MRGESECNSRWSDATEGGVGLTWLFPEGVEFEPWKRVHTKRSDETDADFFLRELRLTRALGFLLQICPAAMEETKLGLHKRLSNKRVASAVEITLKAQELVARLQPGAQLQAHPDMIRRILENGSWTEDDWIRQWWAGLLVSSCSTDVPDSSTPCLLICWRSLCLFIFACWRSSAPRRQKWSRQASLRRSWKCIAHRRN